MYCKNCGKEVDDKAVICPHCGCQTGNKPASNVEDKANAGWGVLGFFFPLIGLILYLVWKDNKPLTAHVVGKGALIGVIVSVTISILSVVLVIGCASCVLATL